MQNKTEVPISQLKESLLNLAWDCQSYWIGEDGVDSWTDEQVKNTTKNIIKSLTVLKKDNYAEEVE